MKNTPQSNHAHHSDSESRNENLPPIKSYVETRRSRPPAHPLSMRSNGSKHVNFKQFRPKINVNQLKTYKDYNRKVLKHLLIAKSRLPAFSEDHLRNKLSNSLRQIEQRSTCFKSPLSKSLCMAEREILREYVAYLTDLMVVTSN